MIVDLYREYKIIKHMRKLARQRVAMVLQPGNVWVLEKAPPHNEESDQILLTCWIRGWVEPHSFDIPQAQLTPEGGLPSAASIKRANFYRLTDGGWHAIHRTHELSILAIMLTIISMILALK